MQVKLVRYTPEPEKTVAMSARLCYSPIGAAQLEEKISDADLFTYRVCLTLYEW